jgi:hypothetical protein
MTNTVGQSQHTKWDGASVFIDAFGNFVGNAIIRPTYGVKPKVDEATGKLEAEPIKPTNDKTITPERQVREQLTANAPQNESGANALAARDNQLEANVQITGPTPNGDCIQGCADEYINADGENEILVTGNRHEKGWFDRHIVDPVVHLAQTMFSSPTKTAGGLVGTAADGFLSTLGMLGSMNGSPYDYRPVDLQRGAILEAAARRNLYGMMPHGGEFYAGATDSVLKQGIDNVTLASGLFTLGKAGLSRLGKSGATTGGGVTNIIARDAVNLDEFNRLNVMDAGKGKFAPGEAGAAAELQNYLGGNLERINLPNSNADFVFTSGAHEGKTVDFMFTPNDLVSANKTNQFFEKNLLRNETTLNLHLDKADLIPLDFRFLTEKNQNFFMDVIQRQSLERQSKIVIFR